MARWFSRLSKWPGWDYLHYGFNGLLNSLVLTSTAAVPLSLIFLFSHQFWLGFETDDRFELAGQITELVWLGLTLGAMEFAIPSMVTALFFGVILPWWPSRWLPFWTSLVGLPLIAVYLKLRSHMPGTPEYPTHAASIAVIMVVAWLSFWGGCQGALEVYQKEKKEEEEDAKAAESPAEPLPEPESSAVIPRPAPKPSLPPSTEEPASSPIIPRPGPGRRRRGPGK